MVIISGFLESKQISTGVQCFTVYMQSLSNYGRKLGEQEYYPIIGFSEQIFYKLKICMELQGVIFNGPAPKISKCQLVSKV